MDINEKAAYLKGLFDGYELENSKEGKLIGELLDLVGEMAEKITSLEAETEELRDYIEEVDEDLGAIEDDFYLDDGEEDEEDEEDEGDSEYYEVVCPSCGETVCFDESLDPDELICPACGEKINDVELCDGNCDGCDEDCPEKK